MRTYGRMQDGDGNWVELVGIDDYVGVRHVLRGEWIWLGRWAEPLDKDMFRCALRHWGECGRLTELGRTVRRAMAE